MRFPYRTVFSLLLAFPLLAPSIRSHAQGQTTSTTVPVQFTSTVDAQRAKPGDRLQAKVLQEASLDDGQTLPKGTLLSAHVVTAHPFAQEPGYYAAQKDSVLSIRFDPIGTNQNSRIVLRALATSDAAYLSSFPHNDEFDVFGTNQQIGGDTFAPTDKVVLSKTGDVVGFNRKKGVYARLIGANALTADSLIHCGASPQEQPMAIFSADACGLYGFEEHTYLSDNGQNEGSTFTLKSSRYSLQLRKGSTALLVVTTSQH